eukprot:6662935-Karenia_brevis.AAC.1
MRPWVSGFALNRDNGRVMQSRDRRDVGNPRNGQNMDMLVNVFMKVMLMGIGRINAIFGAAATLDT